MKYKLLFTEILIGAMLGYACGVVFADTPMAKLRLSTDMNGGGHSITNLDTISVSNEPWATPSEVTNIVTNIGGGIGEEEDPIALPIAYTAITNAATAQATADLATTIGTNALAIAQAALPVTYNSANKIYYVGAGKSLFLPSSTESSMLGARISNNAFYFAFDTREIEGMTAIYSTYFNQDGVYSAFTDDYDEYHFGKGLWPDTYTDSPLIKRDELAATNDLIRADMSEALEGIVVVEADPLSVHKSGGTMTGLLTLSQDGVALYGSGIATNFIIKAEYDVTNVSFNVYEVSR